MLSTAGLAASRDPAAGQVEGLTSYPQSTRKVIAVKIQQFLRVKVLVGVNQVVFVFAQQLKNQVRQ